MGRAQANASLEGLSTGDAFGERFFGPVDLVREALAKRALPPAIWSWTDDTMMALGIVEVLEEHGRIDQEALAQVFGRRYRLDPSRGYGAAAHELLTKLNVGVPWREATVEPFGGQGSMGNGSAMRVAPLGAWFCDDLARCVEEARLSAQVTHWHPEGQAGAIAVAVAAAYFAASTGKAFDAGDFFEAVLARTPPGPTRDGIEHARDTPQETVAPHAAAKLGNGGKVLCSDTVPFTLWIAARHPDDYQEALWQTGTGLGDRDTTCAIVGGIVAARVGLEGIPPSWIQRRELLLRR